ncbi:hypothetical protein SAMN06295937_100398 [Sphingopyxis flava]|uniref:Uncharacterized protein n=1 Tax=Sphingopyxis flava TaxID=1507287 RepID=A0A1T5ACB4_9SPHN|nr:hypothetical protein SAMN06295937_100398 [Sphingopyxis flava]
MRHEHPASYVCRLYNDRLSRSGSSLRWVTTPGGGMALTSIAKRRGAPVAESRDQERNLL